MIRANIRRNLRFWIVVACLLAGDCLAGWLAFYVTLHPHLLAAGYTSKDTLLVLTIVQSAVVLLLFLYGRYRVDPTVSRFVEVQTVFKVTLLLALVFVLMKEFTGLPIIVESAEVLRSWITFAVFLSVNRIVVRQTQKILLHRGIGGKNTLVVGINERARHMAKELKDVHLGYHVVGFITPASADVEVSHVDGLPVLSTVANIQEVIAEQRISEVVIALDKPNHDRLLDIITYANGSPVSLKISPDMYEVVSGLAKTEQIAGLPLIHINPDIMTRPQRLLKRLVDLIISFIVLVPLFPFWLILGLAIKVDSRGRVLYRQERVGMNGRRFVAYKFRSMVKDAETHTGPVWADVDDPRITKVGRFMRRFRLDEVPQFVNVILGQMSIVGPRPERPYFVQQLSEEFPFYYRRHKIRPGITGWAQIKHPYDSDLEDVREKLKYDFFYIENAGLSLDLKIMVSTIAVMLSGKGR
ncbi:MAG: sugar transferase [Fidelibacterota bacterium]